MDQPNLKDHQRINDILLGPLERPALAWLARNMPAWVTPDMLTAIGFLSSVLIAVSYGLTSVHPAFLWLASVGFILNWFGDSLDGTLARYRKIERPHYGFFIDHLVDTASVVLIFVGLGLSPYVNLTIALLGAISYLQTSIVVYLLMITKGVFRISFAKIGPTEVRAMAILANAIIFFIGNPTLITPLGLFTLYDVIVVFVGTLLLVFSAIVAAQTGAELARQDDIAREKKAIAATRKERRRAKVKSARRAGTARGTVHGMPPA
jgi:archaetidylinositol phosphate synthase